MLMLWDFDEFYFIEYISNFVILSICYLFLLFIIFSIFFVFLLYKLYFFNSFAILPLFAVDAIRHIIW